MENVKNENCTNCACPHFRGKDWIGEYVACWEHPDAVDHAMLMYDPEKKSCDNWLSNKFDQCAICQFYKDHTCHHKSNTEIKEENEELSFSYKCKEPNEKACEHFKKI